MQEYGEAGILSAIVGNICVNVAINLQSHAKKQLVTLALRGFPSVVFRDRLWWLGVALLISGEFSNFIAYGLAPASIVSPLGVFAVIANCVIPPLIFDEMPHIQTIKGTVIAMPGILLLILAAPGLKRPEEAPEFGPEVRAYVIYYLVACIVLALCRVTAQTNSKRHFFSNVMMGALMGSCSVLSIKALSLRVLCHRPEINVPICTMILFGGAILQFSLLIETLQYFAMYQVIPHHFILFTILVATGSYVIFHEFSISDGLTLVELVMGSGLSVGGVFVAARPHEHSPQEPFASASQSGPSMRREPQLDLRREPQLDLRRASIATINHMPKVVIDTPERRKRRRRNRRKRAQRSEPITRSRRNASIITIPPVAFATPGGTEYSPPTGGLFSSAYARGFPGTGSPGSPMSSSPLTRISEVAGERLPLLENVLDNEFSA